MHILGSRDYPRIEGDYYVLPLSSVALEMMTGGVSNYKYLFAYPCIQKEDMIFLSPIPLSKNVTSINLFLEDKQEACHPLLELLSGEQKSEYKANILKIDDRSLKASASVSIIIDQSPGAKTAKDIEEELENNCREGK